jgi:hypothetical protein
MWQRRGEFLFHTNSQTFPILAILLIGIAITLNKHGGVTNRLRFVSVRGDG